MKKVIYTVSFLVLLSTAFGQSAAGQKDVRQNVAVMEFTAKGVSGDEAGMLADMFRSDLVGTRIFKVLDRNNMEKILKEQSFQGSGCTDTSCAVEIGKLLNMKYMIVGTFSKFGSTYVLVVDIIDVETSEIVDSAKANALAIDAMIAESGNIAKQFAIKASGGSVQTTT